jgi:uncharacterized protein (TIGR03118 family)
VPVMTIPTQSCDMLPSAPPGVVFNPTQSFGGAQFIFAGEDGTISAWTGGAQATVKVDNSATAARYKALAIGNNGTADLLYATNFCAGTIDVFTSSFTPAPMPSGAFTDPKMPPGYAPFGIQCIGGKIYVSFARQEAAKQDDTARTDDGYVDIFDTNGALLERSAVRGLLNSPWGLALAPMLPV